MDAIELEACGWYGAAHGSAHDKTGLERRPAEERLLSLCFCGACRDAYEAAPPGAAIAASLLAVAALGGHPQSLPAQAGAVRAAGATELRLYHAGLAGPAELAAIRALCRSGQQPGGPVASSQPSLAT